jgi:hypothetical protein
MTYKAEDYKNVENASKLCFAELYIFGNDGDIFECTDSPIHAFIGTRVLVKQSFNSVILVHPNQADSLVSPFGALTAGTFERLEKVESYIEIALSIAVRKIMDQEPVFISRAWSKDYQEITTPYIELHELGIADFDDLNDVKFFIKK